MSSEKIKKLRITLKRSPIDYNQKQKITVRTLGLRRMHQMVEHRDTPQIRGMIAKVSHLVEVEELE